MPALRQFEGGGCGAGDQVRTVPLPPIARTRISAWLDSRGRHPGPLWIGRRGALTISGIVQVVLAVGDDAKLPGLRPHRLRHTYATLSVPNTLSAALICSFV